QLKEHTARLYNGNPVLGASLTGTHSSLSGFFSNRLVGEDLDPDLTATLDITCHRDTSRLNLIGSNPGRLQGNKAKLALIDHIAACGFTLHTATLHATIFNAFGQ